MKLKTVLVALIAILVSCHSKNKKAVETGSKMMTGTWQLLQGVLIEKGDTTITDYTKNISFIKIINDTHFAFLQHDLNKGKDSPVV
jgi:hypothetical protein